MMRDVLGQLGVDRPAAVAPDPDVRAEQRLGGGRAEADERLGLHERELGLEPRQAGGRPASGRASGGSGACPAACSGSA